MSAIVSQLGILASKGLEPGAILGIVLVVLFAGFIWYANRPSVIQRYSTRDLDAMDGAADTKPDGARTP